MLDTNRVQLHLVLILPQLFAFMMIIVKNIHLILTNSVSISGGVVVYSCQSLAPGRLVETRSRGKAIDIILFITARKRSLRRLCFYRCLSVHMGGGVSGLIRGHAWFYLGGCMVLFGGQCVVFSVFSDTMRYGQWVGGTHPTGMHSSLFNFFGKTPSPKSVWLQQFYFWFAIIYHKMQWRIHWVLGTCPPLGLISFIFMQFLAKKLPNNLPLPLGNPGYTTVRYSAVDLD